MTILSTNIHSAITKDTVAGTGSIPLLSLGYDQGVHRLVVNDGSITLANREVITFSVTEPKPNKGSPGGYTQARVRVSLKSPFTKADGSIVYNTFKSEMATDIETSDVERDYYRGLMSLMTNWTTYDNAWNNQVLS